MHQILVKLSTSRSVQFRDCTFGDVFSSPLPEVFWGIQRLVFKDCSFSKSGQVELLDAIQQSSLYQSLKSISISFMGREAFKFMQLHNMHKVDSNPSSLFKEAGKQGVIAVSSDRKTLMKAGPRVWQSCYLSANLPRG